MWLWDYIWYCFEALLFSTYERLYLYMYVHTCISAYTHSHIFPLFGKWGTLNQNIFINKWAAWGWADTLGHGTLSLSVVYFTWRHSTWSIVTYWEADSIFQGGRKRSKLADSFILGICYSWKIKWNQGYFHFIKRKCKQNSVQSGNHLNIWKYNMIK